MDLGLAGAVAVVTGGSKGIGRAAARCLAEDGARVCIMARGQMAIDDAVTMLKSTGSPDAFGVSVDPPARTTAWSTRSARRPGTSSS